MTSLPIGYGSGPILDAFKEGENEDLNNYIEKIEIFLETTKNASKYLSEHLTSTQKSELCRLEGQLKSTIEIFNDESVTNTPINSVPGTPRLSGTSTPIKISAPISQPYDYFENDSDCELSSNSLPSSPTKHFHRGNKIKSKSSRSESVSCYSNQRKKPISSSSRRRNKDHENIKIEKAVRKAMQLIRDDEIREKNNFNSSPRNKHKRDLRSSNPISKYFVYYTLSKV